MARVNYFDIETTLEDILKDDPTLAGTTILVEEELTFQQDDIVIIYLDRRVAPANEQSLSAGKRTRMDLSFSIWCFHYGLELRDVMKARDDLLGKIEIVLMNNRTLRDKVETSWLEGGEFQTLKTEDQAFMSGAEIVLTTKVIATTD